MITRARPFSIDSAAMTPTHRVQSPSPMTHRRDEEKDRARYGQNVSDPGPRRQRRATFQAGEEVREGAHVGGIALYSAVNISTTTKNTLTAIAYVTSRTAP